MVADECVAYMMTLHHIEAENVAERCYMIMSHQISKNTRTHTHIPESKLDKHGD